MRKNRTHFGAHLTTRSGARPSSVRSGKSPVLVLLKTTLLLVLSIEAVFILLAVFLRGMQLLAAR